MDSKGLPRTGMAVLPFDLAFRHRVVVIEIGTRTVTVASPRPTEAFRTIVATTLRRPEVEHVLVSDEEYHRLLQATYPADRSAAFSISAPAAPLDAEANVEEDADATAYLEALLEEAVNDHVTDIHLERSEQQGIIRFRIDRNLDENRKRTVPTSLIDRLIRVLRISSKAAPDDALAKGGQRFTLPHSGRYIDVRLQIIPTINGDEAALRLMGTALRLFPLDGLGIPPSILSLYRTILASRTGGHLIVGPVNAGKSTTQRAVAMEVADIIKRSSNGRAGAKIVSAEDPVELRQGYSQVEIDEPRGIKYETIVSRLVRMDYDLLILGEINEAVTAGAFFDAAMAGRLLVGSFHALDAVVAIIRLIDMGIRPSTIQSGLKTVLYQRLLDKLCTHCRIAQTPMGLVRAQLDMLFEEKPKSIFRRGDGCEHCKGTGVAGVYPVFELLPITARVSNAIIEHGVYDAIVDAAMKDTEQTNNGYLPMSVSALNAVREGIVSWESAQETIWVR